jgi:CHAT domain-containing protein/tetratricopeptide (TPR) repeat protein
MRHLYTILFFLTSLYLQAQTIPSNPNQTDKKGLRQGKWTILYDKDWNIIQESANAQFYRLITYKDDKPIGKVYDMYANGKIQMETTLLADRPQDVMNGETIFYNEEGKKQKIQIFEKGNLIDEFVYDVEGNLIIENWQTLDSLANVYNKQKNYALAFELWNRAKLKVAKGLGKKHKNYLKLLENLGYLYLDLNRYGEAENIFLEAIQGRKSTTGEKDLDYVRILRGLANAYNYMGKYAKSEPLLLEAINIFKKYIGENNLEYSKTVRGLGIVYYYMANYPKAEEYLIEAKNILEKINSKESLDYAYVLSSLGNLYRYIGKYAEAEPVMQVSLAILKKNNDPFYSSALGNLALMYQNKGDIKQAISTFLEVLSIQEVQLGKNHPNYANTLYNLGSLYQQSSNLPQAEAMCLEALKIQRTVLGEKHPKYLETLSALALIYEKIGNYPQAESLYKQSLIGTKEALGEQHPNYASNLNKLGIFYSQKYDDIVTAEPMLLEAIKIIGKHFGENSSDYANYLSNLGIFYLEVANYQKAEEILLKSLKILQKNLGTDHLYCARVMNSLGNLYQTIADPQAENMLIEAVAINYKTFGEKSNEYAYSIANLGVYYKNTDKLLKADSLFNKALNIQKEVMGESNREYLLTHFNVASINQDLNNYQKAEALSLENIKRWKETVGTLIPEYERGLNLLGRLYDINSEYTKAFPYYQESSVRLMNILERKFPIMSQKEKQLYLQQMNEKFVDYIYFTYLALQKKLNYVGWIYNNILFNKGILLNNQNKIRNRILTSKDSTLQARYQEWHSKRNFLAQVYQMSVEDKIKKGIDEAKLEEEANQIEIEISKSSELFAKANEKTRFTWQDVQKKLKKNEVAIEIVRFKKPRRLGVGLSDTVYYGALIITPQTKDNPEMVVLENGKDLEEKQLKIYQNSLQLQKADKTSYDQYWKVIADKLNTNYKSKKIYFSPDGVYNQINLNTLQNPKTGKYLSEELEIQLLSNTKDLILQSGLKKKAIKSGIFIGYPDYNQGQKNAPAKKDDERNLSFTVNQTPKLDSTQRFFNGVTISELPNTKVEIENIKTIFQKNQLQSQIYLAEIATEELVKSLQNPQILHIATHGFFLQNTGNEVGVEERSFMGIENQKISENPLLRSGLLLAGATQVLRGKTDEGILTAYEAMNLDLDNTDLVVMSACETGLGEIQNGEGVYGLQRAFQVAGAKSILMSLWTVSDEATKDLMTLFYDNWITKKQTKREAFNNAQKTLRSKYKHPYYWGAFVMVGE